MTNFAEVNGLRIIEGSRLVIPNTGPWYLDLCLDQEATLTGAVVVTIGDVTFRGTVAPVATGDFVASSKLRVVGGAAGWGKSLGPKGYHNDAQVKASTVITDAARECGETAGRLPSTRLGPDWARRAGFASAALEAAADGIPWYVDFDGVTHVEARPSVETLFDGPPVLDWNPRTQVARIEAHAFGTIAIGSKITDERFKGTKVVREIVVTFGEGLTIDAWCCDADSTKGRLARALAAVVQQQSQRIYGTWRYRVGMTHSDRRVDLQAINRDAPVPSLSHVVQVPGIPGAQNTLALGSEVFVEFLEGDPSLPRVVGYTPKGGRGFEPEELIIGKESTAAKAATEGDTVRVLLPPMVFNGTIGGTPAAGVVAALTGSTLGTIETTKVQKVKIG